jgi:hypothetical protein
LAFCRSRCRQFRRRVYPNVCAADESFINFDNAAELINVLHECDADFVTHFPRGLIGTKAHVSIDLKRAHPLLANEHQMNDAIPFAKRLIGVFENRSGDMRKAVGNTLSAVHALPLESHGFKLIDVPVPQRGQLTPLGQRRATR